MRRLIFFLFLLVVLRRRFGAAQQYDLVLEGGRVIDPETGLDGVRNVGIRDGKIVRVSAEALSGRRVIHAGGLVVAPGFIDLHQHGQDMASQRVKALDGVTTALEFEIGAPDVAQFLKAKEGRSLIQLRHVGEPSGGAGCGVWRAFAGWDDPAQERAGHRSAGHSGTDRSYTSSGCGRSLMLAGWRLVWASNMRRELRGWK